MFSLKQEPSVIKNQAQFVEFIDRYNALRTLDQEDRPRNYAFVMPGIRTEIGDYLLGLGADDVYGEWVDAGFPVIDDVRKEIFLSATSK